MIILSVSANISILSAYATYNQGFNFIEVPLTVYPYLIVSPLFTDRHTKNVGIPIGSRGIAKHLTAHKENAHVYDVGIHHCF